MQYLRIKLKTGDPFEVTEVLKKEGLSPLNWVFLKREGLLLLTYPAETVDELLKRLEEVLKDEEVVEVEVSDDPFPSAKKFSVGRLRFCVPLTVPPLKEEDELYITASLSFGSGAHPTTRLCLELLVEVFEERTFRKVLDLGCGSGILALAAAHLGAERVVAVDIDEMACREALKNVRLNELESKILVVKDSAYAFKEESFDLVLANLTVGTLKFLLPEVLRLLSSDGVVLVSGFSPEQFLDLIPEEALAVRELKREGWMAALLRKRSEEERCRRKTA